MKNTSNRIGRKFTAPETEALAMLGNILLGIPNKKSKAEKIALYKKLKNNPTNRKKTKKSDK